jgi:hypothetical protein
MDLLIATWTLRVAVVAALAVGGASISAGTPVVESVDRGLAAAVVFTFAGRWLAGWLEPPERRLLRMRKKREARRAKADKAAKPDTKAAKSETRAGKPDAPAKAAAKSKSPSAVSRTA